MLFADGMREAHVANGVVRLALAMLGGDGKPAPAGVVMVPLTQLPAFANAIIALTRQVEAKLREAQQQQAPPPDGGFRLGS
ncbi:MAG: hypothetical protein NZM27_07030 [Acetobacteraceae bacterium]|nr:hypothetical protein [Acetobacteraceae bacterium]MDW8398086.1 hypothetical protein [Acetobacteraceae bacterium]